MLSFILFSCLLLSVQAQKCHFSEIIRHTNSLLSEGSASCPCRETAINSCLCLPIAKRGHELACFVEGTEHMLQNNVSSHEIVTRLKQSFQMQLDRKLCQEPDMTAEMCVMQGKAIKVGQSLARGDQCLYEKKGNVEEFLKKIQTAYQSINKSRA